MAASGERPKVLLLGKIDHAHSTWSQIATLADILTPSTTPTTRASLLADLQTPPFASLTAIYLTLEGLAPLAPFDAPLVSALPPTLRFLTLRGAGYDAIDVAAFSARGIRVSNTPTVVDDATADTALFLLLGALRRLARAVRAIREGKWMGEPRAELGRDPGGKVLGIVGMGRIGGNFARKAAALGMRVRYYNRRRVGEERERETGAEWVEWERLLGESDVLSLHVPLNEETHHMISTPQFNMMKPGVVIINTARGAVIDEAALVEALSSGRVASAGLDVYEHEPAIHQGLLANPDVFLLPHMGTQTVETQTKMEEWTMANLRKALLEGDLVSVVPEQRDLKM